MGQSETDEFLERIAATAIVNQAVIKCGLSGAPMNADNVVLFIGDFFDPQRSGFDSLVKRISETIDEVMNISSVSGRTMNS